MMATERSRVSSMHSFRLFSADLDGTLVGDPTATERFARVWDSLPADQRPLLVYNTGRTVLDTRGLVAARQLPEPDFIIGSVGTELHDATRSSRADEFRVQFTEQWDRVAVERIVGGIAGVTRQPETHCSEFKSSWFWPRARPGEIVELQMQLRTAGLAVHVDYSCRYFLDVVPARAGKGRALSWLCERLKIPLAKVLVAGDTGNDISMFALTGVKGIVVQNALPELLAQVARVGAFVAQGSTADGVLEGLEHYGVVPRARVLGSEPRVSGVALDVQPVPVR